MMKSDLAIDGGKRAYPFGTSLWPLPDDDVRLALERAYLDGSWGRYEGPHVSQLAADLASHHQLEFVLPCCSGTFAVELALRALRIDAGDEVVLGGYDFPGNFRAIEAVGALPVLVDVSTHTWCLDADLVSEAVTSKTRGIIASHLHSGIADMQKLRAIADQYGIGLIEDACQAPGAMVHGRVAGRWGDVSVLSFGGSKLLSAGRGGAILMSQPEAYQRAKIFCERGNQAFPLSELQAAVLLPQLRKLDERNAIRQKNVDRLVASMAPIRGVRFVGSNPSDSIPSFYKVAWSYSRQECGGWSRQQWIAAAQAEGLPVDAGFRGFSRRGSRCRKTGPLHNSLEAADCSLLLHHPVLLESEDRISTIARGLAKVCQAAQEST